MTTEKNTKVKLSIIIPVYNVERYVQACLKSVYDQELDESVFEVIIINDGTKDRSMDLIQDIINQHQNIIVINQENQGLSIARNNGIAKAIGDYIIFLDSDDLLCRNSLHMLLGKAVNSKADLIVADYQEMNDEEIDSLSNMISENPRYTEKTGEQMLLEELNPRKCYVWRAIYRKDFLQKNNILFVPNIFFEDIPFTHICYLKANKCLRTNQVLYIYRRGNLSSATYRLTKQKAQNLATSISKLWELTKLEELSPQIRSRLQDNTFVAFSILLYAVVNDITEQQTRIEIINYLKQLIPDLQFKHGFKQRINFFLYRHMPCTYINLRLLYKKATKYV